MSRCTLQSTAEKIDALILANVTQKMSSGLVGRTEPDSLLLLTSAPPAWLSIRVPSGKLMRASMLHVWKTLTDMIEPFLDPSSAGWDIF